MPETEHRPLRGVKDFFNERGRMIDAFVDRGRETERRTPATAWAPITDILARERDLVIRMEVPGVEVDDVDITFANSVLTVSGERYTEQGEDHWGYYIRERFYGAFQRSIGLPDGIVEDDISARFDNGLLIITIRGGVGSAMEIKKISITKGGRS